MKFGAPARRSDLPLHPMVRQHARAAEQDSITSWLAEHGATPCPTRFVAVTEHAVIGDQARDKVRSITFASDIKTVDDCRAWLTAMGYGAPVRKSMQSWWMPGLGRHIRASQMVEYVRGLQTSNASKRLRKDRDAYLARVRG